MCSGRIPAPHREHHRRYPDLCWWVRERGNEKKIDRGSQLITVGAMLLAAVAATFAFIHIVVHGNTGNVELFTWMSSGTLEFSWALVAIRLPLSCC